jgi:hypothetical protein
MKPFQFIREINRDNNKPTPYKNLKIISKNNNISIHVHTKPPTNSKQKL